jgi:hypothetical protein
MPQFRMKFFQHTQILKMKALTFSLLLLLSLSNLKAQDKMEEAANFAADYLCNCVNKVYAEVEPDIRDLIIKIYLLPAEEQTEFILGLSEEKQSKILQQSLIMADEGKAAEMDECNNSMAKEIDKKYKNLDESSFNEQELLETMSNRLKSKNKCEFAYMLLKIGLEQQQISEDALIEEEEEGGEEGQ